MAFTMANMKNMNRHLSANQINPGTQMNGATGNSGSQYQFNIPQLPSCASTIADRLSDPAHSRTVMMTKPMETSYETICAAERSDERNGYFEFDDHPAMITP